MQSKSDNQYTHCSSLCEDSFSIDYQNAVVSLNYVMQMWWLPYYVSSHSFGYSLPHPNKDQLIQFHEELITQFEIVLNQW